MSFKKTTTVRLPFDRKHKEPSKNYGIGGLIITYVLQGPKGSVQFQLGVGVFLPHIEDFRPDGDCGRFSGYDVGYHSPKPMFEGQMPLTHECEYVEGGKCYYDGSSLRAVGWTKELFSIRGESIEPHLWAKLEEEYKERFGDT